MYCKHKYLHHTLFGSIVMIILIYDKYEALKKINDGGSFDIFFLFVKKKKTIEKLKQLEAVHRKRRRQKKIQ